jgi:hypothetical protein
MTVVRPSALAVIDVVGGYNQEHGGDQKPNLISMKKLFQDQHQDSEAKNKEGLLVVMVLSVTMGQRIASNGSSQQDHENLKPNIVDDIDAQHRKTGQYQRQKRTMDSTSYRSGNSEGIIVNLYHGGATKLILLQQSCILNRWYNWNDKRNFVSINDYE